MAATTEPVDLAAALAQARAGRAPVSRAEGAPARAGDAPCACGGALRRGLCGYSLECDECGLISEREEDAPREPACAARLRLVGPGSAALQPDLYRSAAPITAAQQQRAVLEEYVVYRDEHVARGGRAFPQDVLALAAAYYNEVQQHCVKRAQNKKAIMATFFYQACHEKGFAPSKAEAAAFMQLESGGISRGANLVRALAARGHVQLDVDADACAPEICALFTARGLGAPAFDSLRAATLAVVQRAVAENIGTNSVLRSKVAGAAFVVLRRCPPGGLVLRPPTAAEFCASHIRKNTIDRFVRQLEAHHEFFAPIYAEFGLDAAPPPAARARPTRARSRAPALSAPAPGLPALSALPAEA